MGCNAEVTRPNFGDTKNVLFRGRTSKIILSRIPSDDVARKWFYASPESPASSRPSRPVTSISRAFLARLQESLGHPALTAQQRLTLALGCLPLTLQITLHVYVLSSPCRF